jgi:enoyl-CoA hydratase/carnithine racemase
MHYDLPDAIRVETDGLRIVTGEGRAFSAGGDFDLRWWPR